MSRILVPLVALAGIAALTACTTGPVVTSATTSSSSASSTAVPSETPTLTPGTPTPSATPSATPTASGSSRPAPSVPATAGAYNVAGHMAAFASPSGRIWCGTDGTFALCHFPAGMKATIPSGETVCPGEGLDVTGVTVEGGAPKYFCSGDPSAFPTKGSEDVAWHAGKGLPFVAYNGFTLAVLPYGKSIVSGKYVCNSAELGVTCANTVTKRGFRMSSLGPEFF